MTSSLVGSEMCIRDRTRRELHQGRTGARLAGQFGLALLLQTSSAASVSYTHLTLPTICSV
eukprot:5883680-Prorocentrum_lima.AAC.1